MSAAVAFVPSRLRRVAQLTILVPKKSNLGIAFSRTQFFQFEEYLRSHAGGWTRETDVRGNWPNALGAVVRDASRKYVVVVSPAISSTLAANIESHIIRKFQQDAAFVTITFIQATTF